MPTITRQQLARWMNGEISDPDEYARIADAVERDPEVGRWFDLMDLDRFVEHEDVEPLPTELAELAGSIFSACSRSVLFPIKFADPSWGNALRAAGEVAGQLTRWVPGGKEVLELRLKRVAEQPATYRMDIMNWPEDYEPVCVVLAHLRHSGLQPARYPGMGVTGLAAETDDEETVSIPFPEALTPCSADCRIRPGRCHRRGRNARGPADRDRVRRHPWQAEPQPLVAAGRRGNSRGQID